MAAYLVMLLRDKDQISLEGGEVEDGDLLRGKGGSKALYITVLV